MNEHQIMAIEQSIAAIEHARNVMIYFLVIVAVGFSCAMAGPYFGLSYKSDAWQKRAKIIWLIGLSIMGADICGLLLVWTVGW